MSALILIADDMRLRLYNYNTMEKVKDMEAHADYIRFVEIHPTLPYILSSSDDMSIKLWNWEQNWDCTSSFEGHAHYVMMCKFNPKDTNTFASADSSYNPKYVDTKLGMGDAGIYRDNVNSLKHNVKDLNKNVTTLATFLNQ